MTGIILISKPYHTPTNLKVLIFEHLSGGGMAEEPLQAEMLCEGYSMLRSALEDFKGAGHKTVTFLDARLMALRPPLRTDEIHVIGSQEALKTKFEEVLKRADASLIIAPEPDGTLYSLLTQVEGHDALSLNCPPETVKTISDKSRLHDALVRGQVAVPETRWVNLAEGVQGVQRVARDLGLPLVLKPIEGVGCSGLGIVRKEGDILRALHRVKGATKSNGYLIQRLAEGVPVSVSLLADGRRALPLTLNLQKIIPHPTGALSYVGGAVPLGHRWSEQTLLLAKRVVELFEGVKGYVGVDLILSKSGPVVIEINPRITTSYVGLRMVSNVNLAQAMIESVLNGRLPSSFKPNGHAFFSKQALPIASDKLVKKTFTMKGVIAPPFPIEDNKKMYTLLATVGRDFREAQRFLRRAQHHLLGLLRGRMD